MGDEQEFTAAEQEKTSSNNLGLGIVVGAGLGYVVGRTLLNKPVLGTILGAALAFAAGSSGDGE